MLSRGEVLSRGRWGDVVQREGGVVQGGRCCPEGGGVVQRKGGVVQRGRCCPGGEVLSRGGCCPEGGVVQRGEVLSTPLPQNYRMTDTCKNITFARFATRAVKTNAFMQKTYEYFEVSIWQGFARKVTASAVCDVCLPI